MLHNIIYEIPIKDGLHAVIDEKSSGRYIFRIVQHKEHRTAVLAVVNVSEHEQFGELECYIEAAKMDESINIRDFIPLFQFMEFHVAWFKRKLDEGAKLVPLPINEQYYNVKYKSR